VTNIKKPRDIYFHSDRLNVTYRIYCLLDEQKSKLLEFLLRQNAGEPDCPLPILGGKENRKRVEAEEPVLTTGIYRDPWERKEISPDENIRRTRRRIMDGINYNSWEDSQAAVRRGRKMEDGWLSRHYGDLEQGEQGEQG